MITTTSGNTIKYSFQSPNGIILVDPNDNTKTLSFDLSQLAPNSTVVMNAPSSSGSLPSISSGFASLSNSTVTVLNSGVKSTSIIVATYQNTTNTFDVENSGTLFVENIVPNVSFDIKSTKQTDNNLVSYIVVN